MNYDFVFISYDSVFHNKNDLFYATQVIIVHRSGTVLSYKNVFFSQSYVSYYASGHVSRKE